MNLDKFSAGISKTGFVLENRITQDLKKHGWSVISNKYYEDDFEDKVREIDLIAYKVGKVHDFDVYTCLIISCKKSESNVWALLCRSLNHKDPNLDIRPLHSWSNQPSLQYQLNKPNHANEYYKDMSQLGVKEVLDDPSHDIFAFQEMNAESGAPQNQKAIYDSIISLIKAQAYEMSVLPERKKEPCVYQFNLLSIVDANMILLKFKGDEIYAETTLCEHYVSRYILNRKQSFSKIRFINASVFESTLKDYEKLHQSNIIWYGKTCDKFYEEIEKDSVRLKIFSNEFSKEIRLKLCSRIYKLFKRSINLNSINLFWNESKNSLVIFLDAKENIEEIAFEINDDPDTTNFISEALNKIYRYTGPFLIEADIPF